MPELTPLPQISTSPISVILIARAFETDAQETLADWQAYLNGLKRPFEIIILQESRPEVALEATQETSPAIRTLMFERSAGFRDALNEAIRSAQYPLLAFSTCDKQYAPANLDQLLKDIDRVHLVVGYRAGGQAPPWRVLLDTLFGVLSRILIGVTLDPRVSWLGSEGWGRRWIARWIFGVRVSDPECPFRLARREIFAHLPIQSGGSFAYVEMLAKANHLTCFLAEGHVTWSAPTSPSVDAISFGQDASIVFRDPDFGPYLRPVEPTAPDQPAAT